MIKLDYKPSASDPCLFFRKNKGEDTLTITSVYVDDGGCIGTKEVITATLEGLSKDFSIKVLGPLKNYVGSNLIEDKANQQMWITQPKLIKNMEEVFGDQLTGGVVHVPAAPKTGVVRPKEGETVIDPEEQSKFRTGVDNF